MTIVHKGFEVRISRSVEKSVGLPQEHIEKLVDELLRSPRQEGSTTHPYLFGKGGGIVAAWKVGVVVWWSDRKIYIAFPEEFPPDTKFHFADCGIDH